MSDILNLTIKIMPSGDEIEVELSAYNTARELLEELIKNNTVSAKDAEGSHISYDLIHRRTNTALDNITFLGHGVQQNDILLCVPRLIPANAQRNNSKIKTLFASLSKGKKPNHLIKLIFTGMLIKDEVEMEIPRYFTGKEIILELVSKKIIPTADSQGFPYRYQLISISLNRPIQENTSLIEVGIEEGDLIDCSPNLNGEWGISGVVENATISIARPGMDDYINIIIRVMPQGEEVDVELPLAATGAEIIQELMFSDVIPNRDPEGNLYVYQLISTFSNRKIEDHDSLISAGVQNDEILICMPRLEAGGFPGNLIYQLPSVLKLGEKAAGQVRISREGLQELLRKGLAPEAKLHRIEINDVMEVTLEENALKELLKIKPLNRTGQIISDDSYSEWNFDLYPDTAKPGFTALLLRVTMVEMLQGFGERKKDVFLLNHEVEITHGQAQNNREFIHNFRQIYEWTEQFRQEIYDFIRDNHTGRALSKLANFYQQCDRDVFHSVLLLQAQWNEGRNQHLTNRITDNDWYMVQARVNMGILELVRDIETHVTDQAWNGAGNGPLVEGLIGWVTGVRDGLSL